MTDGADEAAEVAAYDQPTGLDAPPDLYGQPYDTWSDALPEEFGQPENPQEDAEDFIDWNAEPVVIDASQEISQPRVLEENGRQNLMNFVYGMHYLCQGENWVYRPENHIKHTVYTFTTPLYRMLKDHSWVLPQKDVFFSHCFF